MPSSVVSCIVPVFNGERYLQEALESIRSQTYRPLDIVVVDDGSTDGSADIAKAFRERVRYVRQSNAGPSSARNSGLTVATGEFVAFLDQDDLWHQEKLARQIARFAARPELDLCVTYARNFWSPELLEGTDRHQNDPREQGVPGYFTSALLARRMLFDKVGRFDPSLTHSDDTEWFLRAADLGAVSELLPEVLTYHRMHHSNLGYQKGADCRREYLLLLKQSLDRRRGRSAPRSPTPPA
jgi:glycosyltransferase involved in cell wall biosynthesis